jgi:phosphatidylglycerol---prolipoprotein diacylglyceryl transferase
MFPTLLKIGPVPIHSYGFLIATGFLVSIFLMRRDAAKQGINPDIISDCAFWVLFLGILGTRVLHIIMFPDQYSWRDPLGWVAIWRGGLVFHGALPPAILFCIYYMRKHKVPVWQFADVVTPYVPLGHAFGRMGCFMFGCCYGKPTDSFLGIRFPRVPYDTSLPAEGSPAFLDHMRRFGIDSHDHWSNPVYPTQLMEAAGLLAIWVLLFSLRKYWHPFTGFTFPAYLFCYGVLRFLLEFLRGDGNPAHIAGIFSDQQIVSLIMVVSGAVLFAILKYWNRSRPAA